MSVKEYSTFGGTSGYTLRIIRPSASSSFNCFVNEPWDIPDKKTSNEYKPWSNCRIK